MHRSLLAFLAGALFCLAGVIELLTALLRHSGAGSAAVNASLTSVAVMFLGAGLLWIAVGARWKRDKHRQDRQDRPRELPPASSGDSPMGAPE